MRLYMCFCGYLPPGSYQLTCMSAVIQLNLINLEVDLQNYNKLHIHKHLIFRYTHIDMLTSILKANFTYLVYYVCTE